MMRLSSRLLVAAAAVGTSVLGSEQLSLLRRTTNDGTDHKTDELPRGAKSGNDKFMEALETITDEQKVSLFLHARALDRVSEHVDWERLRDNYLTAKYISEDRRRRLKGSKDVQKKLGKSNVTTKKVEEEPQKQGELNDLKVQKVQAKLENEVKMAVATAFSKTPPTGQSDHNKSPRAITPKKTKRIGTNVELRFEVPMKKKRTGTSVALRFEVPTPDADTSQANIEIDPLKDVQGRVEDDDGIIIPNYEYSTGNCPDDGDSTKAVPCAPDNLDQICDKADPDDQGKFSLCFEACLPAFCCIHDAPPTTNFISPSCNEDVNCAAYSCCYIVWWKLHDTVGPATQLRVEQNDDFFDVPADFIEGDVTNVQFYREMLFHHFNDAQEIIRLGTVPVNETSAAFNSDAIFLNSTYWDTEI